MREVLGSSANLERVVREGFSGDITLEQRPGWRGQWTKQMSEGRRVEANRTCAGKPLTVEHDGRFWRKCVWAPLYLLRTTIWVIGHVELIASWLWIECLFHWPYILVNVAVSGCEKQLFKIWREKRWMRALAWACPGSGDDWDKVMND